MPAMCASGSAATSRALVLPGWPGYDPLPPPHTTLTRLQRAALLPLLRRVRQHGVDQQGQVGADVEGGGSSGCCRIQARLRSMGGKAGRVLEGGRQLPESSLLGCVNLAFSWQQARLANPEHAELNSAPALPWGPAPAPCAAPPPWPVRG